MALPDTIGVSYDIDISPKPLAVTVAITTTENKLGFKVDDIDDLSISVKPNKDNGVTDLMISGVLMPLALILKGKIETIIEDKVKKVKKENLFPIQKQTVNFGGQTFTIETDQINLSNFSNMLMVTGHFKID